MFLSTCHSEKSICMYWPYNSCVLCTQIQWWGTRGYPPLRGHMVPASSDSLDGVFFWHIFCHNRITPRPSCSSVVQKWNVVSINRSDSTPLVWIIERRSGSDGVLISAVLLIWCSCFSCVVFDLHCTTFPGEGDGRSEADRWGLNEWSTDANTSCQPRSCLINPKMRWACEKWCDQKINPIKSSQHLELGVCVCVQECGLKVHRASTRTYRICLVTCISALQWISISKAGSWSGGKCVLSRVWAADLRSHLSPWQNPVLLSTLTAGGTIQPWWKTNSQLTIFTKWSIETIG